MIDLTLFLRKNHSPKFQRGLIIFSHIYQLYPYIQLNPTMEWLVGETVTEMGDYATEDMG